jgi:uncharacterized RDD family membrane protein YckC
MVIDLQRAGMWKRLAAWMFDSILVAILAVGLGFALSGLLDYDGWNQKLDDAYNRYETRYGVVFDISQEEYERKTPDEKKIWEDAYAALINDSEAMQAYNMMISLTMVITTLGILGSFMLLEFAVPLWLKDGRTLGKLIFGLGLMREDGVRMNTMQLFVRTLLGKFTLETMVPVCIIILIFFNAMGLNGTLILAALLVGQSACVGLTRGNKAIHDLLAGTVCVDFNSQLIFESSEALLESKKKLAAERAAAANY